MNESLEQSFAEIVEFIHTARQCVFQTVNTALIDLYWQVGEYCRHLLGYRSVGLC